MLVWFAPQCLCFRAGRRVGGLAAAAQPAGVMHQGAGFASPADAGRLHLRGRPRRKDHVHLRDRLRAPRPLAGTPPSWRGGGASISVGSIRRPNKLSCLQLNVRRYATVHYFINLLTIVGYRRLKKDCFSMGWTRKDNYGRKGWICGK